MNWKNIFQKGLPGPIKIGVAFLKFFLGNFSVREVGRLPKVGILYEEEKAVEEDFLGPAKIGYTL